MRSHLVAVLALLALVVTGNAGAQHAQQWVVRPVIGGAPVTCALPTGAPVLTAIRPIPQNYGFGRSLIAQGTPLIILSPQYYQSAPQPVQLFFYAHECMHHALGHTLGNIGVTMEIDADCRGVGLLRAQGLITAQGAWTIAAYFENAPAMPPLYPAGPERSARILACAGG